MITHIRTFNDEDAMVVVKVLIQNGFTVRVYQTDETLVETIIEYGKPERENEPSRE